MLKSARQRVVMLIRKDSRKGDVISNLRPILLAKQRVKDLGQSVSKTFTPIGGQTYEGGAILLYS